MSQIAQYSFTQSSSISQIQAFYQEGGHFGGGFIERDGLLETVPKTPAYVFGERVVAPLLRGAGVMLRKFDEAFTRAIGFLPVVKADDTGLIGWFDGECPEGWTEYTKLEGRVAVGVGTYDEIAHDGRKEVVSYSVGEKGGERAHVLTLDEMPKHNHQLTKDSRGMISARRNPAGLHSLTYEPKSDVAGIWFGEGDNQEHNNMQPYLALRACQKTNKDEQTLKEVYTMKSKIESLQKTAETQGSEMLSLKIAISILFGAVVGGAVVFSRQALSAREANSSSQSRR